MVTRLSIMREFLEASPNIFVSTFSNPNPSTSQAMHVSHTENVLVLDGRLNLTTMLDPLV